MKRRVWGAFLVATALALTAAAQSDGGYLDLYIVKVKPEKRAEFEAISKKIVDANRRNKGDTWIASETTFGEQNTVFFWSRRDTYAGIEKGESMFEGAVAKAFGPAGVAKLFQDFGSTLANSRGEVRRVRPDLSRNAPKDGATGNKLIGEARWYRSTIVRIRPGRLGQYEAQLKANQAAFERADAPGVVLVSQSNAGQQGTVFYLTSFQTSLAGFDASAPSLAKVLGEEGYQRYVKTTQECVLATESIINRILPELSNPPAEIAAVAPAFWTPKPKPVPAAKPKPKAEAAGAAKTD